MEVDLVPPGHVGHDSRTSTLQPSVKLSFRMGGKRPRPINDEFFDEGELEYKLAWQRLNHHNVYIPAVEGFDPSKDNQTAAPWKAPRPIVCRQAPCHGELTFSSASAYEQHYDANHRYLCYTCGKPMPGERWLKLHIHEIHDVLVKIRRERGERTYQCFVVGCPQAFKSTHGRRLHLIDRHMYPRSFNFDIVKEGAVPFEKRIRKFGLKRAHKEATTRWRESVRNDRSMDTDSSSSSREASPSFDDNEPGNTHKIQTASGGNPRLTQDQESACNMDGDAAVRPSNGMDMEIDQLQDNLSKLKLPKTPKTHAPVDRPKMQPGFYRGPPISMHSQLQGANLTESSPSAIPVPSATSRSNTWMVPRQVKTSKALPRPTCTPMHRDVSME